MSKLRLFILSVVMFVAYISLNAQEPENIFLSGTINADTHFIDVIVKIEKHSTGFEASLFIPEQFVYKMNASNVYYSEDSVFFMFREIGSEYSATYSIETQSFIGGWKQGSKIYPTELTIDNSDLSFLDRPQTPKPPFDYYIQDFFIENSKADCTLAGTLTMPDSTGVYPLVILVSGSGAQDRNEEIAGHKPFWIIADQLAKNGIAVFRFDDRGFAKSTGDIANATTYDFMTDVLAIVKFFENHPNIDKKRIGVAGHSEGGIIAMMIAAKHPKNIDFIISLAGPGVNIKDLLLKQVEDINRASGVSEEHLLILNQMQTELMQVPEKSKDNYQLRKMLTDVYDKYATNFTEEEQKEYRLNSQGVNIAMMQFSSPWMRYFLSIEPHKYLKKIKCPVLALNGNKDIQVYADENLDAIFKNLSKSKYYEVQKLEGLNHLFQEAETGTVSEYYTIPQTISENVIKMMIDFINYVENLK